ncbi:hypothetical protein [Embleya sp. NPDC005971]|uniref:hypothetical protein n=1 Tax=Embleya sp. NPDC005971 TaxID=3156724 RepID=UPI0033D05809
MYLVDARVGGQSPAAALYEAVAGCLGPGFVAGLDGLFEVAVASLAEPSRVRGPVFRMRGVMFRA